MFKSTKSQFAIRKLSKGAVAVLLTFGIFANTSSGIVSATVNDGIDISAIEIRGDTIDTTESSVEDITPESTTEVSTSNFIPLACSFFSNTVQRGQCVEYNTIFI